MLPTQIYDRTTQFNKIHEKVYTYLQSTCEEKKRHLLVTRSVIMSVKNDLGINPALHGV